MSSIARGRVAGPSVSDPSDPGVVALVPLLTGPAGGEKSVGDGTEADAEDTDGGVMDGLAKS